MMQKTHAEAERAMDFAWFHDLGRLARTGHFSQAAAQSNISQPAFSRRIRQLETWVGAPLVDRTRHPVSLTIAGVQMLEAGLQALEGIEHERRQVRKTAELPDRQVVTFGMPHSIAWRFYPDWLETFERRCRPVRSRMRADDLPDCVEALALGDIDFLIGYRSRLSLGVSNDTPRLRSLESVSIGTDRLVPVCKPGPDGGPRFRFGPSTGDPIPWLRYGSAASISEHVEPLLDSFGVTERLVAVYENTMAGALRIRAREGVGVAWLPRSLIAPDLDSGVLTLTGDPAWSVALEIRLYRLRDASSAVTESVWARLTGEGGGRIDRTGNGADSLDCPDVAEAT